MPISALIWREKFGEVHLKCINFLLSSSSRFILPSCPLQVTHNAKQAELEPNMGPQQARPPRILFTNDKLSSLRFFSAELRDFQSPTVMLTTALELPGGAAFLLCVPRTKATSGSLSAGAEGKAREGSVSHVAAWGPWQGLRPTGTQTTLLLCAQ